LVEEKTPVAQEYFAAITWDGRKKCPVLIFSDMGGIDIEEVAEKHPEHVSKTHFSSIFPITPRIAKEAIGATGVTGDALTRLTPIVFELMRVFPAYDLTLAEINPLARLADGRFLVLDGHIDMEAEARGKHKKLLPTWASGTKRRARRAGDAFEIRGAPVTRRPPRSRNVAILKPGLIGAGGVAHASDAVKARRQAGQLRDRRQPIVNRPGGAPVGPSNPASRRSRS
jgi:succinyl-CoA synthetase beta subunit